MNAVIKEDIKRWTARRKSALLLEIIHGTNHQRHKQQDPQRCGPYAS